VREHRCTPTKTLVASAYAAFLARRAGDYGVTIGGPVGVDMRAVKARKDTITVASRRGVERSLRTLEGCTVYEGHARFVANNKVAVNGVEFGADRIFINVGGRASIPPISGLDQVPYFTNSSMMDIDFLPPHLIVLGGSYIGLEFAQAYRRFGSEVTVIELAPRLIAREDEDASHAVADFLKEEGIDVRVDSKVIGVEKQGNSIAVKLESAGKISQVVGTHMLVAIGRRPNTDDLGLDNAGVATDSHGYIQVDDQLRTNVPGIWAMGDCNGRGAFTHTSWNDFEIVAANILDNEQRRVSDRITAYALYTDPPLARAGMTQEEVRKTGKPALVSTMALEDVSRAYETCGPSRRVRTLSRWHRGGVSSARSERWKAARSKGFMKILADRDSKRILGASLLGLAGDEIIHCIIDLMYAKAPYTVMQRAMHIHPTVSEFLPIMMQDFRPLQ